MHESEFVHLLTHKREVIKELLFLTRKEAREKQGRATARKNATKLVTGSNPAYMHTNVQFQLRITSPETNF